jgi:hypothetical protein
MLESKEFDPFNGSTDLVQVYVEQFKSFSRKSAISVIEMGKTVVQAKVLPDEKDYEQFCLGIRFDKKSKALFKLESIGKKADVLIRYADLLPSNWTTLYILSRLDEAEISSLAEQGKLQVCMLGSEAQQHVDIIKGKLASSKRNQNADNAEPASNNQAVLADKSYSLAIQFDMTPTYDEVSELKSLIDEYAKRTKCSVQFSKILEELLAQVELLAESEV